MKVNEIFDSIQGEGVYATVPMTFIRLQGCNLACEWCDTAYARDSGGFEMTIPEITKVVQRIDLRQFRWICITGGEPLLHEDLKELVLALASRGYRIEVETNGTIEPPAWYRKVDSWVADIKTPSSGWCGSSRPEWFNARRKDQVKFVVADSADLEFVAKTLSGRICKPQIVISPVLPCDTQWRQTVWSFCVVNKYRFSLQLHKMVWGNMKGV